MGLGAERMFSKSIAINASAFSGLKETDALLSTALLLGPKGCSREKGLECRKGRVPRLKGPGFGMLHCPQDLLWPLEDRTTPAPHHGFGQDLNYRCRASSAKPAVHQDPVSLPHPQSTPGP